MKKFMKRIVPLVLIVVMCVCMAAPAFAAAGATVPTSMAAFPAQKTSHYDSGCTKVIQRFLYIYKTKTRELIVTSGGIDGVFGSKTEEAVINFQSDHSTLSNDGVFGQQSWPWLASRLTYRGQSLGYDQYSYVGQILVSLSYMNGHSLNGLLTTNSSWYCYQHEDLVNEGAQIISSTYWSNAFNP